MKERPAWVDASRRGLFAGGLRGSGTGGIAVLRRRSPGLMMLAVLPFLAGCDLTAQQMPPSHPYFVFFAPNSAVLDSPARTIVADAAAYAKV